MNFPSLSQGDTSAPMTLTVTNSGNAPLKISSLLLNGNNPIDFSNPSGNCLAGPIAPTTSCTLTATFTPQAVDLRQATFTFIDNAPGSPHLINLTGTGIAAPSIPTPASKVTPTTVTFPTITQGLASAPLTVTITNPGTAPLHISAITAGGSSPTDFTNSFSPCATATVGANATCTMTVVFSPIFSGPRSETISITDDAPNSPHVLNVFANAAPAFTLTSLSSALSATITAGQTAIYNLQLTPGTDFSGTVSFTCTGAPLGATCQAPASITLNVGAPAAVPITVPTSNGAATLPQISSRNSRRTSPQNPAPQIFFTIICLVFLCGFVAIHARKVLRPESSLRLAQTFWRRTFSLEGSRFAPNLFPQLFTVCTYRGHWKNICAIAALIIFPIIFPTVFLALAGCGGGNPAPPASQGGSATTPRGTSTLVLTPITLGTSGKPLQLPPIQLTLTVN